MTSSSAASFCVCAAEYYHDVCYTSRETLNDPTCRDKEVHPTTKSCFRCPQGVTCTDGGSTLDNMAINDDYWRRDAFSKKVLPCPIPGACNASRLGVNGTGANSTCAFGQEGPMCMVCSRGWARWGSNEPCKECKLDAGGVIGSVCLILLGLLILIVFLYLNRKFPDGSLRPVINTWQQLSVVLLFNSDWPESLKALGSFLQSINLELPLATPTCMGIPFNYYWRLVLMVIFTGSVIGLPWLWSLRHFRNKEKWEEHVVNRLRDTFILILIMHPSISGLAFQFFRCQKFTSPLGEDNMLVIDYSITCHDETWYGMLVFVLFVVIFFSIGMPVLFAVFLWRRRESLEDDRTKKLLGILYKTYRPSMYYYESIQMLFKVALWACLVMLEDGSQFQLALGLVICFVQVAMHARFMPFSNKWKNILQYVGLALSAGMSFAGLVINYLKEAQNNQMREGHKARAEMLTGQIEMFKHVTEVLTITSLFLVGMGALFKTWTKRKKVAKWLVKKMRKVGNKLRTRMSSNSGTGDVELPETKTAETGDAPTVMNSNPMSTVLPRETPSRSQLSPKERREVEEADKARKECERVKNESIRKQMGSFIARGEGSFIARGGGSGIRGRGRRGQISSDGGSEAKGTAAVEKAGSITRGGSGGSCGDTRHCQPDCANIIADGATLGNEKTCDGPASGTFVGSNPIHRAKGTSAKFIGERDVVSGKQTLPPSAVRRTSITLGDLLTEKNTTFSTSRSFGRESISFASPTTSGSNHDANGGGSVQRIVAHAKAAKTKKDQIAIADVTDDDDDDNDVNDHDEEELEGEWFFVDDDGDVQGPHPTDHMIHWIEEGHLEGETLVVGNGDSEWVTASACWATLKAVAAEEGVSGGGQTPGKQLEAGATMVKLKKVSGSVGNDKGDGDTGGVGISNSGRDGTDVTKVTEKTEVRERARTARPDSLSRKQRLQRIMRQKRDEEMEVQGSSRHASIEI